MAKVVLAGKSLSDPGGAIVQRLSQPFLSILFTQSVVNAVNLVNAVSAVQKLFQTHFPR